PSRGALPRAALRPVSMSPSPSLCIADAEGRQRARRYCGSTMAGLRILSLVPFTPRLDGRHGGSRATGQLLEPLTLPHLVAVLHARWPGAAPADATLSARSAAVETGLE